MKLYHVCLTFFIGCLLCSKGYLGALSDTEAAASVDAAKAWLHLVDTGQYDESWNQASVILKLIMPQFSWVQLLKITRAPLGSLVSRELVEARPSENPKGLPPGQYIVLLFKSSFSNKESAQELITLTLDSGGKWHVLTYSVS